MDLERADERREIAQGPDPTWAADIRHFEEMAAARAPVMIAARVGEHRIPPRFLGVKPAPHALAMVRANGRGDVVAAAKAHPGKLTYGFGGIATAPHLAISQLAIVANIDMLGVPLSFDQRDLVEVLRGNPITRSMLELCPAKYSRY